MLQAFGAGRQSSVYRGIHHLPNEIFECQANLVLSEELACEGALVVLLQRPDSQDISGCLSTNEADTYSLVMNSTNAKGM